MKFPGYFTSLPLVYLNDLSEIFCNRCAEKLYEETGEICQKENYVSGPSINCYKCGKELKSLKGELK